MPRPGSVNPSGVPVSRDDEQQAGQVWFRAARVGLIILLLAAPLAFGAVQTSAWAAVVIATVGLLICWAIGCARQRVVTIRWSALYFIGGLFILLSLSQFLGGFTLDRIGTREGLLKFTADILLFFLAAQLFATASRRFWGKFGITVTVYACALALFAIVQFFSNPDLIYWSITPRFGGAPFGPYVNHNHYAGLMEMLLPIMGTFLLARTGNHPVRWIGAFAMLIAFASVELSGSRGGIISLLAEIGIFGILFSRTQTPLGKHRVAGMSGIAFVLVIAAFLWIAPPEVIARYQSALASPDVTFGMRKQISLDALRAFRDYRWFGTGLGSFETVYPRYQTVLADRVVDHVHNDFVELTEEMGMAGLALVLVSLGTFLTTFRKLTLRFDDLGESIRLGATVGCCGVLVHSFTDFNLHIPANAAWFSICAGISQLSIPAHLSGRASSHNGQRTG